MLIIGITGTLGAGKGTIVEYLIKQKGFGHYSVRQFLIEEIKNQGLPVNRDSMVVTANALRARYNPAYIIQELFKDAKKKNENAVIESIRTPGEIDFLEQQGDFVLLAVDADPQIRYERITHRQSSTDEVNYQTFIEDEKREMSTTDPNKQNLKKCIEKANIVLTNNGTVEELYAQLEDKLTI